MADLHTGAPAHPWQVFWVASVAGFLVSLDTTMLFAAFDPLRHAFRESSVADLSWVLNAYTVVYATLLIPSGGLADTYGRKRVFLFGVTLFLAASAACGLAGSVGGLLAARLLQAVGAALLTPASLSIVLAAFPQTRRAVVVSLWGAVGGLAAAVGPSAGSLVIDRFGWPWAFYIKLPLGGLALWRGASLLIESARSGQRRKIDGVGMALMILAVGALTLAIVESDAPNWRRAELVALGATGVLAAAAFVAWVRHAAAPLVVMPTAIVTSHLASRLGHRRCLLSGSLLYACSSLWFLLVPGVEPQYLTHWLPGLMMNGIAVGLVLPSLSAAAVSRLSIAHYAVGSSVNQATRQIDSVLGVALTVALLGHAALHRTDFQTLYLAHGALALLTGLLCLPVDTRPRPVPQRA